MFALIGQSTRTYEFLNQLKSSCCGSVFVFMTRVQNPIPVRVVLWYEDIPVYRIVDWEQPHSFPNLSGERDATTSGEPGRRVVLQRWRAAKSQAARMAGAGGSEAFLHLDFA